MNVNSIISGRVVSPLLRVGGGRGLNAWSLGKVASMALAVGLAIVIILTFAVFMKPAILVLGLGMNISSSTSMSRIIVISNTFSYPAKVMVTTKARPSAWLINRP